MKNVEILTCNSKYENGKCVGGYHEIHMVEYLSCVSHLIATIDSIIKNNLLYGCNEASLESVLISCYDQNVIDEINRHYNGMCGKIKIETCCSDMD